MNINLVELKYIINRLFDHIIETRNMKNCELDEDYYWNIPTSEVYQIYNNPSKINIGSLYDDWEFLSKILDTEDQPAANQLTELAPILRYLGEYLGNKLAQYGG